jgi:hypothetical protein
MDNDEVAVAQQPPNGRRREAAFHQLATGDDTVLTRQETAQDLVEVRALPG